MSIATKIARRWKPLAIGSTFGLAEGIGINKVTSENPSLWWWLLVAVGLVGVIGCGLWAVLMETDEAGERGGNTIPGDVKDSVVTQQSSGDGGRVISVSATEGSVAAYRIDEIKELNIGEQPRRRRTDGEPEHS
ncbi:hypothetical protein [Mycolicibacterium obuense]|uniref:Uncharacterized protein n=1 Tax=Mycolicibacterium obuense TaxID=1807 RepID=A0A0J6YNK5_9MYCO|nr:hypothetical protein [Mycolicibacterium obuense]KMO74281.1 hypothetical protein MOBUDSM44075_03670 [Mycolicibacterium obuense]